MEEIGIGAGLGALGFWVFIATCVAGGIWDSIRKREAQHETLRRMIESGQPIETTLSDKLLALGGGSSKSLGRDLRVSGLIILFVAPGLAIFGWVMAQAVAEVLWPVMLGVSALLGCVSLGFFVAARVVERGYREDGVAAPTLNEA